MILTTILEKNSRKFGNYPALTMRMGYRTISLTYQEVYDTARCVALFLEKNQINKGDTLLICAPNSPYWIALFWGCLLRGVIVVPLTIQSTIPMVQKIAEQTDAKILFTSLHNKQTFGTLQTYALELIPEFIAPFSPTNFIVQPIDPNDIVEIMYTSGTTGDPKGVVLTHKNFCANLMAITDIYPVSGTEERLLSILPLSHIYEQTIGFLLPYSVGAHIIYAHSHAAIRDLLKKHCITKMLAVPEFLKAFMNKIETQAEQKGKKRLLETLFKLSLAINNTWFSRLLFKRILKTFGGRLNTIASGGAPLDPILEMKWQALGITIMQGYGLTETSPVIASNSFQEHRHGSVGKIVPGLEVKLDEQGEILVKGPSVFQGYFKNKEKTHETFTADGFFKTGDMGFFDADGFLFLKGRKKYMIKGAGAQNVYPEDIEAELNEIAQVEDSCVIGLEKPGGIVDIHAVLLLAPRDASTTHDTQPEKFSKKTLEKTLEKPLEKTPGKTLEKIPEKIIEQANAHLASYQQINSWSIWPEPDFPRSATRKVKKNEVTAYVMQQKTKTTSEEKPTQQIITPLIKILAQLTGITPHEIHENSKLIQQLHLDSLLRIELILHLEEELGVIIDETKISQNSTVADLEQMIAHPAPIPEHAKLKQWPRSWWARCLRMIGQFFFFSISKIFVHLKVEGVENLQQIKLPLILMPNHLSYFDSCALSRALPRTIRYRLAHAAAQDVLYEEYKYFAPLAELLFNSFPFPRKEQENIKQGLDCMGQLLDQGYSVVMFPEGKISTTGALQPLKAGAGLIGVEMGVAVIPVKLEGTDLIFPYNKMLPCKRGTVRVIFGKPLYFSKAETYHEATQKIEHALQHLT